MDAADYDPLYLQGIEHFNVCDFFESHEVVGRAVDRLPRPLAQVLSGADPGGRGLAPLRQRQHPRGKEAILELPGIPRPVPSGASRVWTSTSSSAQLNGLLHRSDGQHGRVSQDRDRSRADPRNPPGGRTFVAGHHVYGCPSSPGSSGRDSSADRRRDVRDAGEDRSRRGEDAPSWEDEPGTGMPRTPK